MENPTHKAGYTQNELREYAFYRKEKEMERLQNLNNIEDTEEREESEENREPLSFEIEKTIKILLSWGGDSDGYKLTFDKENELISGVYFWSDWGVYEEVELSEEELNSVYDLYLYGDASSFLDN